MFASRQLVHLTLPENLSVARSGGSERGGERGGERGVVRGGKGGEDGGGKGGGDGVAVGGWGGVGDRGGSGGGDTRGVGGGANIQDASAPAASRGGCPEPKPCASAAASSAGFASPGAFSAAAHGTSLSACAEVLKAWPVGARAVSCALEAQVDGDALAVACALHGGTAEQTPAVETLPTPTLNMNTACPNGPASQ